MNISSDSDIFFQFYLVKYFSFHCYFQLFEKREPIKKHKFNEIVITENI